MNCFDDFSEEIGSIKKKDKLIASLDHYLHQYGYDQRALVLMNDHPSLMMEKETITYNFSKTWRHRYGEQGYIKWDPVLTELHAFNHQPFYWSSLHQLTLKRKQQQILSEGIASGLYHGAAIPLVGMNGELACLSIASSDENLDFKDYHLISLKMISNTIFDQFRKLTNYSLTQSWLDLDLPNRFLKIIPLLSLPNKNIAAQLDLEVETVRGYIRDLNTLLQIRGYHIYSKEKAYEFFKSYSLRTIKKK